MQTIASFQMLRLLCIQKASIFLQTRRDQRREHCRELFIYNSKCGWDRAFYQFVNSIYIDCTFQLDSITFSFYFRVMFFHLFLSLFLFFSLYHSLFLLLIHIENIKFSYLGRIVMIFLFHFHFSHFGDSRMTEVYLHQSNRRRRKRKYIHTQHEYIKSK